MTGDKPKRGGFATDEQLQPGDDITCLLSPGERWVLLADETERQIMTPEERAGAAVSLYHEDYLGDGGTVPPLEEIIAAAIREAVNEALERAAEIVDQNWDHLGERPSTSAEIRALKHQD